MKRLFSVWLLVAALLPSSTFAAEPIHPPDWLLGKWRVVEIYEYDDAAYKSEIGGNPDFEPKIWYAKKILEVSPDRILMALPLGRPPTPEFPANMHDELCTDFVAIKEEQGTRQQLLNESRGDSFLREVHFPRRPEPVSALKIACGSPARSRNSMGWMIIHPDADTIETSFYGHGYLVLRRVKPRA